jgi:hypothetical protein
VKKVYAKMDKMLESNKFDEMDEVMSLRDRLLDIIGEALKRQLRRIQQNEGGSTKTNILYFNILNETKTMVLQSRNLLKSQKYFISSGQ